MAINKPVMPAASDMLTADGKLSGAGTHFLSDVERKVNQSLSATLDDEIGSTRGMVLVRGESAWLARTPSVIGQTLTFDGTDTNFAAPVKRQVIQLYDRTLGTPIGNMTGRGGLSAAFDGNPDKGFTSCAEGPSPTVGGAYIGKAFHAPQKVAAIVFTGANSTQISNGGGQVSIDLWAANSSPGSSTSGTAISLPNRILSSTGVIPDIRTSYSISLLDTWSHFWVRINNETSGTQWCAQLDIYVYVDEP